MDLLNKQENKQLLIKYLIHWEGIRYKSYKCSANIWTIGIGNTFYKDKSKVKENDTITKEEAISLCIWYINKYIIDCIKDLNLKTINQYIAIISLIYNIGNGAFMSSTLRKVLLNNGKEFDIRRQWKSWCKVKGIVNKGLLKRREEELGLFFDN